MGIIFTMTVTSKTLNYLIKIPVIFIILAAAAHIASWLFWALRIKILAKSLDANISLYKCFKIVLVNLLLASITPSGMGGEPARILMLRKHTGSGNATAIIIGERMIDFLFFGVALPILLLILGMSISMEGLEYYLITAALILGILTGLFLYLLSRKDKIKKLLNKLERIIGIFVKDKEKRKNTIRKIENEYDSFFKGTIKIFKKKGFFTLTFLSTSLMWIMDFFIPSIILIGLGFDPHWLFVLTSMLIVVLITIIPITPGGTGLAEFSGYFLFSQIVPADVAAILVIMWRVITFYPNLLLGLFYTLQYTSIGSEVKKRDEFGK